MSRDEFHRRCAIDTLTFILCLPFCWRLGWVGIFPALIIGIVLNVLTEKKEQPHD
jgi:hypothetical protein